MKLFEWLFLLLLIPASAMVAQKPSGPFIGNPVYFDVSLPLRDQIQILSKQADRSWKDGAVPNNFNPEAPKMYLFSERDTIIQHTTGRHFPDTIIRNYNGLGNINNVVPPDTHGDVGPSHYFQLVNMSFAIYDKAGVMLLGPRNTSTIWDGLPHNFNNGDGIVLYDEQADRWLISQFSLPTFPVGPFYQMVAVSQTPDPTGAWYRWEYEFGDLPDYPKFGIWPDSYYMSFTRLKSETLKRDGIGVVAFDRSAMLNGDPQARIIQFNLANPYTILPADCDGQFPPVGTPNYFSNFESGFFVIREFHADWLDPQTATFGNVRKLPVAPFTGCSNGIPQKGTDRLLTPLDDRFMYRLQYRKFSDHEAMVVNHTVGVGIRAGIRWYELQKTNGSWFVSQQSTFSPDTLSRWMGSIAMDSDGNMALGYSVSGRNIYPSIRFTGRMKHDPPGQMTIGETTIAEGSGSQTGIWAGEGRWGDYSSMSVDPVAQSTFWYTQEYYSTTSWNGWKTKIASFSFADIMDIDASATPPEVCTGGTTQLNVEVLTGPGAESYAWTSNPPGFTSDLKSPWVSPAGQTTYIVAVTSGTQVKTDSLIVPVIPPATVNAGQDTVVCRYLEEFDISGMATNYQRVEWYATGDGYFSHPGNLQTSYHPGVHDRSAGVCRLALVAYPAAACLPVADTVTIRVDSCTGLDQPGIAGSDLQITPNPVRGYFIAEVTGARGQEVNCAIINTRGEILYTEKVKPDGDRLRREFNVTRFDNGVYYFRVVMKSGVVTQPVVIY